MAQRLGKWFTTVLVMWGCALGLLIVVTTGLGAMTPGEAAKGSWSRPRAPASAMTLARTGGGSGRADLSGGGVAPRPQAAAVVQAQPNEYAGQDTCLVCHEDKQYGRTLHGRTADPRTPAATEGCESCHGPGRAHAESGGDTTLIRRLKAIAPREANAVCTTCHNRGEHAMWEGSPHEARNLSCTTCHSVHSPKSREKQLVAMTELETCVGCHRDKVTKLDRSGHMPVREGKLQCSSCHNPHGSQNVRQLRVGTSVNETCTTCHADKRGPFLWEHAPVRENCTTCHDPHGSSNERMLVAKAPMLCQRCHAHTRHPGTIYDNAVVRTSNRLYARSCVTCHSNIHGSNHASGNTFLR